MGAGAYVSYVECCVCVCVCVVDVLFPLHAVCRYALHARQIAIHLSLKEKEMLKQTIYVVEFNIS